MHACKATSIDNYTYLQKLQKSQHKIPLHLFASKYPYSKGLIVLKFYMYSEFKYHTISIYITFVYQAASWLLSSTVVKYMCLLLNLHALKVSDEWYIYIHYIPAYLHTFQKIE